MKWLVALATLALAAAVVQADFSKFAKQSKPGSSLDPLRDRFAHGQRADKSQKKRGLLGGIPTYSQGYDIPIVKHSVLKPFVVDYPIQSVPVGVKIPIKAPVNHFKYPLPVGHQVPVPYPGYGLKFPSIQNPTHIHPNVVKSGWTVTKCATNHPAPSQPDIKTVIPAPLPVIPTTVHITPNVLPAPSFAPVLPLPQPPIPFVPKPIFKPLIQVGPAPVFPAPAPIFPAHPPVFPALGPAIIKPGHSTHTSYFATFPKHPLLATGPAVPFTPISSVAPIAPVAPAVPLFGGHVPLHFNKIPLIHPPHVINRIPLHFGQAPVNVVHPHVGPSPIPIHFGPFPANVGHFPLDVSHETGPTQIPLAAGQAPFDVGHNLIFQKPNVQFTSPTFIPASEAPGVQDQSNDNANGANNFVGGDSNPWTPMNPGTTVVYPTQFIPENETPLYQTPDGSNDQQNTDQNQGYHYHNPNPSFDDVNQQQQLQQQHQQHLHHQHQQQLYQQHQQQSHQEQYHNTQFSGNPQHEPQLPQALPNHPLSGRPVNPEYQNHIPLRQHLPLRGRHENFAGYN